MEQSDLLCASLLGKIHDQVDRTRHLIGMIPQDGLAWSPPFSGGWSNSKLLGHLLECLSGFCAVLLAVRPDRLRHFTSLRSLQVNHTCSIGEALARIADYERFIDEGFGAMDDGFLATRIPTVFVPEGKSALAQFLNNLEHLINHKHQLFVNLRLMGVPIGTPDLYRFEP